MDYDGAGAGRGDARTAPSTSRRSGAPTRARSPSRRTCRAIPYLYRLFPFEQRPRAARWPASSASTPRPRSAPTAEPVALTLSQGRQPRDLRAEPRHRRVRRLTTPRRHRHRAHAGRPTGRRDRLRLRPGGRRARLRDGRRGRQRPPPHPGRRSTPSRAGRRKGDIDRLHVAAGHSRHLGRRAPTARTCAG